MTTPNRNDSYFSLPEENDIPELLKDFATLRSDTSVIAGQLTGLMLLDSPDTNMITALNNAGGEGENGQELFALRQRWAMLRLFTIINKLRNAAAEQLQDIPAARLKTTHQEVIRALFKGQIPLADMNVDGFVAETRGWIARFESDTQERMVASQSAFGLR